MPCVGEIEGAFVDAGGLEDVEISGKQREGDGSSSVDTGVFELAFDVEGDGDEATGRGLGEVAGPLVDTDRADDLLGLGDPVHLREGKWRGDRGGQCCRSKEYAEDKGSHRSANEIRRYPRGKVLVSWWTWVRLRRSGSAAIGYTSKHGFGCSAGC